MVACYSLSSIALTVLVVNLFFSSTASSMPAFVPIVATHRPPSNFGQMGELSTGMQPRHGQPLGLRRQRPNSNSQIRSFDTTAATTTLSREEPQKMNFISLEDDNSEWQDPVAVLLYTCVSFQLLFMSLCGQMQVCAYIYCLDANTLTLELPTGSRCNRSNPKGYADYFLSVI
jgi:hypothetical protein